ncbi:hypothetical protein O0235_02040 [Tepidiforma flava]|uniref:Uncharacterized protein n=1 Tax=Tepidiforma flava TaxID=3004094 RepID=A0ABY7M7I7_9CHLR|nr:hypothetical protein [Tepidiforma flava]WBL36375.1 hypothetical protein O0235_02040 [Tepidiforma flava]
MAANPATESSLDLSWLDLYEDAASAEPGKKGLTLKEINLGRYADSARGAGDMTYRMRGAIPRPGAQRFGPNYQSKADVWAENCLMLYEEATQRQWSSARDIPGIRSNPSPMSSSAPCASSPPCSPKSNSSPATSPASGCPSSPPRTSKPASFS